MSISLPLRQEKAFIGRTIALCMAWKNPFRRKSPLRRTPSKQEVQAQGRKAFAQYRALMEHYRSWQEAAQSKSKIIKKFRQWKAKRSMLKTNRLMQKEREKAEQMNARYRRAGGEEIRIPKGEHNQLTGGVPPAAIQAAIQRMELRRLGRAAAPKAIAHQPSREAHFRQSHIPTSERRAVNPTTRKKVRDRLESLYREFRADPAADRATVQKTFRTLADYAKTLKSEEAHARFDVKLKEVVKQLNQQNPMEASRILTQLRDGIHRHMRAQGDRPVEKIKPVKRKPVERPTHAAPPERKKTPDPKAPAAEKKDKPISETTAKESAQSHAKEKAHKPTMWERMRKGGRSVGAALTKFSTRPRKPGKLAKKYDTPSAAVTGIYKALKGRPGAPPVETIAQLKAASESPNPAVRSAAEESINEALVHVRARKASAAGLAIIMGASRVSALQRPQKKTE